MREGLAELEAIISTHFANAALSAPAAPDERDKASSWQDDIALAKSIVSDWLSEKGIALTGVHGEVSTSTVNRFKLDLAFRIAKALESARTGKVEG